MTNEERKKYSKKILKAKNYKVLEFLGQGCYNTVFKCENNSNELVAAKVVIGNEVDVKNEISSAKELESLKYPNWGK